MAQLRQEPIQGRDDFFRLLDELLPIARDFARRAPELGAFSSVVRQLEAIQQWTASGRDPTLDERKKITIGRIIAREIEPADGNEEDFCDKLGQLDFYFAHWLDDPEWLALDDADPITTYFPIIAAQSRAADTPTSIRLEGSVGYSTLAAERDDSKFLQDSENGARVWVPGSMHQSHFVYTGETRSGLAHGDGHATIGVGRNDYHPVVIEGRFRDGVFLGDQDFDDPIIMFPRSDYLVGLPTPRDDDAEFWLENRLREDGQAVRGSGEDRCELVIVAPTGTSALEEDLLRALIAEAAAAYRDRRGSLPTTPAKVVPRDWVLVRQKHGSVEFDRLLCSASVSETIEREITIHSYHNDEAEAAENLRREEEKEAARARGERNAPLRGRGSDVRGLALGMRIEQMADLFADEAGEWVGPKETPGANAPFARPVVKLTLDDGALLVARFTSRQSGSELFLISFEQRYGEGVSAAELVKALEEKYGTPDRVDQRESGTYWGSYELVSGITPPGRTHGPHGAFFKTHVRASLETKTAEMLSIVFNDATLGDHDDTAIYRAQREAAQRKHEQGKSDEIKF